MVDRYSLPEVPEIAVGENNRKLQEVLGYFNQRVERAPCTYLLCNGSDGVEGYTLALDLDKNVRSDKFYRGPRGLAVDLDISYENIFDHIMPTDSVRATFPLGKPGFLQDALARRNIVAELSTRLDKTNRDIFKYDLGGDKVVGVELYDLQDLKQVPKKYLARAEAIKEGTDARKAVDLAFDLWEWDNSM